jgi:WD40 repeat protein
MSPDGKWIAGSSWKTLELLRLPGLASARVFEGHGGVVGALTFSPNSQRLLSYGRQLDTLVYGKREAKLWSVPDGKLQATIYLKESRLDSGAAFSPNGGYVALSHAENLSLYSVAPVSRQ